MEIRFFTAQDAPIVLNWIQTEHEFRVWSADQYDGYPIKPEDMVDKYRHAIQQGEFYPLIFEENGKIVGHLVLRYPTEDKKNIRLGYIIIDRKKRGNGFGAKMIIEAMKYAVNKLGARKFNLGVFTNNKDAYKCYSKIGFKPVSTRRGFFRFHDEEWDWQEMIYDPVEKIHELYEKYVAGPFRIFYEQHVGKTDS